VLVAEEHDAIVEPDAADLRDRRVVEIARKVDAGDFGAEGARDLMDFEITGGGRRHRGSAFYWSMIFSETGTHFSGSCSSPTPHPRFRLSSRASPIAHLR